MMEFKHHFKLLNLPGNHLHITNSQREEHNTHLQRVIRRLQMFSGEKRFIKLEEKERNKLRLKGKLFREAQLAKC